MRKNNNTGKPNQQRQPNRKTALSFLDELKADLAAFFEINDHESFTAAEIFRHFDADERKLQILFGELLNDLVAEKRVMLRADGTYKFEASANEVIGRVDHVNKKFAFIVAEGIDKDLKIETSDLNGAIDGDTVRVAMFSDGFARGQRLEGRVAEVLTRSKTELVGTVEMWPKYAIVTPDSRKVYEEIFVPEGKFNHAKSGDKVIVKVVQWPGRAKRMEGEVVEVLGKAGENNAEMHAILAEFGLPNRFPDEVQAEADAISEVIAETEIAKRRDFRDTLTLTIDPADAKDFDDAISFKTLDNGNYEVGVHIADVSHYVQPRTLLEEEAYRRATSVYLVDRTVPMLPEKLSNQLCSLRPNEDKLTFSAVFEITPNARISKEWFGRTIIHSDKRFSYEEAQEVLELQGSALEAPESEFVQPLHTLNGLAHQLRDERFAKGAINFETVEVKFKLAADGSPLAVVPKVRKDAHKLIEEFMLLANKRVAEFVYSKSRGDEKNTMVYRVHEHPNLEKLKIFADFASRLGYRVKIDGEAQVASALNGLMAKLEGQPEQNVLQQLAVRTMAKARYSVQDLGHFGLAFKRYSHFTSPIRRYPDMMAHRLLQHYIDGGQSADVAWYEQASKHSSEREKLATDAERASIKYKQVEFMSKMPLDRVFEGIITGVTEFGFFVEITENGCEGLVRVADLKDDFYDYNREGLQLVGQQSRRTFTFGDAVEVCVKETNVARRSMDLSLAGGQLERKGRGSRGERSRSGSVPQKPNRPKNANAGKRRR